MFIENKDLAWEEMGKGVRRKIMTYDEHMMLVKVQFEKDAIGSLHSHPHIQISYVESGKFEVEIAGAKKILSAGDVFHVPSNAVHGVVCLEAGMLVDIFNPFREDFLNS